MSLEASCLRTDSASAGSGTAWDEIITRLDGAFVLTHAWSQCVAGGRQANYLVFRKQGEPAAAGWYVHSGRSIGRFVLNRQMEMERLPCYDPTRTSPEEIVSALLSLAERERALALRFGNSPPEYEAALPPNRTLEEKISFDLDLRLSRDVLYGNLKEGLRRKLRKARASGLRIETVGVDDPLFAGLPGLFAHTIARHIGQGKHRTAGESPFFGQAMRRLTAAGKAVVLAVFEGDTPVSCVVLSSHDGRAIYLFGGSSARGYALNAATLLLWTAVERLQDMGYRSFGLGEVPARASREDDPDHGLYRFKKEFGGTAAALISGTVVLKPFEHAVLATMRRFSRGRLPRKG